jgi:MarR-like DNA-binding transcriptional regulator SgrR of sgrS sRNA
MDLDSWNWLCKVAAVISTAIAFVAGAVALFTERELSKRQATQMVRLETDLADAKGRQARAEADLLVLQERARPRVLSDAQRSAILKVLTSRRTKGPLLIEFIGGSVQEPGDFARVLAGVVTQAGWTVTLDGGPAMGSPPSGLFILVADNSETPEWATLLQEALQAGGLTVSLAKSQRPELQPEGGAMIILRVGLKP